jgi:hypothetical protein
MAILVLLHEAEEARSEFGAAAPSHLDRRSDCPPHKGGFLGGRVACRRVSALFLLMLLSTLTALMPAGARAAALDPPPQIPPNSLTIMAGVYTTSFWARSFRVNNIGYEPNFILALISGRDLVTTSWGLRIGHESGIALRFGADFSFEMWRAVTISIGTRLIGGIQLTPTVALGLSTISNLIGVEVAREAAVEDGDFARLVYSGSQVSYLLERFPFAEVFYRLHHRSGVLGFWGNVPDGHNANSVGITFRY